MRNINRISQLIDYKGLSVRAFEISIGASNGAFGRAIKNNTDISSEWLSIIIEKYPDISAEWLLTGEGDMIKRLPPESPVLPIDAPDQNARADKMLDIIDRQAAQIGQLQNQINELTQQNHILTMKLINAPGETEKQKERRTESPGTAVRRP